MLEQNRLDESRATEPGRLKILLGVDRHENYRTVLTLLSRLKLPDAQLALTHIGEPILNPALMPPGAAAADLKGHAAELDLEAEELLSESEILAFRAHLGEGAEVVYWPSYEAGPLDAGDRLIELADRRGASLIAVGSDSKGPFQSFLCGSVGGSLTAHAYRSFVVGRGNLAETGTVRAVFATDFSPYADRCLDLFLALAPQGLRNVAVVFASEGRSNVFSSSADEDQSSVAALKRTWRDKGEELARRVAAKGYGASFTLETGSAIQVLPKAMARTGSEILIVGARGHGFQRRAFLGGVACHEVAHSPYSVWVIRLP